MKKITTLFFLLSILFGASSQNSTAIFSGKIDNFPNDSLKISVYDNLHELSTSYKSSVSSKGKFKFIFPVKDYVSAYFHTGKKTVQLFITAGDSINCYFDYNSAIKTIHFTGNRASHYNYFIKYMKTYNLQHAMFFKPDYSDVFNLSPAEFKDYRKNKVVHDMAFLKNYNIDNYMSNVFKKYCEIEIKYSYYKALASYYSFKKYFKKKEEILPDNFYEELNDSLFIHDDFLISRNYIDAMDLYIGGIQVVYKQDPVLYYNSVFKILNSTFSGKTSYACEKKQILNLFKAQVPNNYKDSIVDNYLKRCIYPEYNIVITEEYNKHLLTRNRILPKHVLNSNFIDTNDRLITFSKLLKKHKGKVLYIDIWASFCGPCIIEMPSSKKLKKELGNKPVSFIYLTVDKDKSKWKKALNKIGVEGEHYMIEAALKSAFTKYFNIYGVPHYILINKKGEVVLPSAPSPSSVGVKSSILTLLK